MSATIGLSSVVCLVVIAAALGSIFFRKKAREARLEAEQARAQSASLHQEISRLRDLRALEVRVGVVVTHDYSNEQLEAFSRIQDVGILRAAVADRLSPVLSARHDLSSDPTDALVGDYPYTSASYYPESRQEQLLQNEEGLRVVRIVATDRITVAYGADPYLYPGAGSTMDGGRRTIVTDITLWPIMATDHLPTCDGAAPGNRPNFPGWR